MLNAIIGHANQNLFGYLCVGSIDRRSEFVQVIEKASPEEETLMKEVLSYIRKAKISDPEELKDLITDALPACDSWRKQEVLKALLNAVESAIDAGLDDPKEFNAFLKDVTAAAGDTPFKLIDALPDILANKETSPHQLVKIMKSITVSRLYDDDVAKIINNRAMNKPDGRPLAVVVFPIPQADWNDAFDHMQSILRDLINKGFRVMYYEVSTDEGFYSSFKEAAKDQKARLLVIGGHASFKRINFGHSSGKEKESYYLDLSDRDEMFGEGLSVLLEGGGGVVLVACSTGEGMAEKENMANSLSSIFPQGRVFSPQEPGALSDLQFDDDKYLKGATYSTALYDPMTMAYECPPSWENISGDHIPLFVSKLRKYPPLPGIKSDAVNSLWCLGTRGDEEQKEETIRALIGLIDGDVETSRVAKRVLVAIGEDAVPILMDNLLASDDVLGLSKSIAKNNGLDWMELISQSLSQDYGIVLPPRESLASSYLQRILLDKNAYGPARRAAALLLGEIHGYGGEERALKKVLGVGLFTFRDGDEELCQLALKSLKKIRGRE